MSIVVRYPLRIAMWSGPRNISTAMMRSWGNRPDTFVTDEPLYAHYLVATGRKHPGAEEVVATYETDWKKVVEQITGDVPEGKTIWFQKHMAHHLLPGMDREWLGSLTHAFLIRDPKEMLISLAKNVPDAKLEDTGLAQQCDIFRDVRKRTGRTPPVLDAKDVLLDPRGQLMRLCMALGVRFWDEMLSWPAGPRPTDGVWAKSWYHEVEKSTTFNPWKPKTDPLPPGMLALYRECLDCYEELYDHRLGREG